MKLRFAFTAALGSAFLAAGFPARAESSAWTVDAAFAYTAAYGMV